MCQQGNTLEKLTYSSSPTIKNTFLWDKWQCLAESTVSILIILCNWAKDLVSLPLSCHIYKMRRTIVTNTASSSSPPSHFGTHHSSGLENASSFDSSPEGFLCLLGTAFSEGLMRITRQTHQLAHPNSEKCSMQSPGHPYGWAPVAPSGNLLIHVLLLASLPSLFHFPNSLKSLPRITSQRNYIRSNPWLKVCIWENAI